MVEVAVVVASYLLKTGGWCPGALLSCLANAIWKKKKENVLLTRVREMLWWLYVVSNFRREIPVP